MHLFRKDADFEALQRVMLEAFQRHPIRILAYCVMSNHWHFAVWPEKDGQLTNFFGGLRTPTPCVGGFRTERWDRGTCIRDDSRVSRFNVTNIC